MINFLDSNNLYKLYFINTDLELSEGKSLDDCSHAIIRFISLMNGEEYSFLEKGNNITLDKYEQSYCNNLFCLEIIDN